MLYKMVLTFDSVAKSFKGDQRNLLSSSFLWCCLLRCKRWLTFASGYGIFIMWLTIEMKANVHYFSVVLFIMFYMVILHVTFYPNPFKSTLAWNHLFSTTLLNYIGISLVFSVWNTSLASKRIIQTWLSNSHGCDVIHVCRQLNAATIIECKSREWCVAFLLAWYDT